MRASVKNISFPVPASTWQLTAVCNSSSTVADTLVWPVPTLDTYMVQADDRKMKAPYAVLRLGVAGTESTALQVGAPALAPTQGGPQQTELQAVRILLAPTGT